MKILMLTSRLPYPPDRGDRLRVFNFCRILSKRHQLTLVTFINRKSELAYLPELKDYFAQIYPIHLTRWSSYISALFTLFQNLPLQVGYYRSGKMKQFLEKHLHEVQYDLIYTHLIRLAPYTRHISGIPKVLDMTDLISTEIERSLAYRHGPSRWLYQIELPRLRNYEQLVAPDYDACWLVSKAEGKQFLSLMPNLQPQIVTNGIDPSVFYPLPDIQRKRRLMFVGHLGVYHNIDAAVFLCREIWPVIQQEFPDYQIDIIGAEPTPVVLQLGALPGVNVHGYVTDLNRALNRTAVFVAPLRFAAGIQNKVLEAMATETPVVTSSLVNEGLGATAGRDLLVADTHDELIQAIRQLIKQPAFAQQIGSQGSQFVNTYFSWENVLPAVAKWMPATGSHYHTNAY